MNKKELISEISLETEVSKKVVESIFNKTFELITKTLANNKETLIPDFGKFVVLQKDSRKGINPKTGEQIIIPASKTAKFKPAKKLKELLTEQ
ncbi:HU family DNA-binding protein [Mycoplasma mycoides]|uniref:HU family DNA-binding protein n=1 Tax=Mycoplasma mycoides TaxID=2102 RepID=UPI00223FCE13|nr:HU family DNA-binding protein [Mycoplasma mycoides]QVK02460.1 HU family DNA-binding protein [Mycoplasma mycoides subsp. capri]QVK03276.1 HU family DNA-binding protein [Mycoplasma mycoides subsp. capri]